MIRRYFLFAARLAARALTVFAPSSSHAQSAPVKIGLFATVSGESLNRGLTIATDEVNAAGGVLGDRTLELVRRVDESNPAKGWLQRGRRSSGRKWRRLSAVQNTQL